MIRTLQLRMGIHSGPVNEVTELLYNPFLRAYKDDPRFIAFAQKVGVMPKTGTSP